MDMTSEYQDESSREGKLLSFLKHIRCSRLQFELIRFLGRHPRAKLSIDVIARAMGIPSIDLRDDIIALIKKEIVVSPQVGKGLTTYALSGDVRVREYACAVAGLDWSQAEVVRRQLDEDLVLHQFR
jgi:hypothetical protein